MKHGSPLLRTGSGLAAVALASAMLAACASQSQPGTTAAADCGTTLKLGILTAFTGELGEFGTVSKNAFDLAISDIQASGALPQGWKIETVVADEKSDVEAGLRAATTMMQQDKVSAIIGPSSGPIVAMNSIAERYRIPIVSQFAGTTNFSAVGGTYLFRTVPSDASDGAAVARYLSEAGAKKVLVVVQNDQSTVTAGKAAEDGLSKSGVTVLPTITYNPGQASYQSVVQQAIGAGADKIYLAGGQASATTILKEFRDAGVPSSTILTSADLLVPDTIEAVGAAWGNGLTAESPKADTARPQYAQLATEYKAKYGEDPGPFAENAYDAVNLVALAAVAGKSTCGEAIATQLPKVSSGGTAVPTFAAGAKALASGEDIDYDGASGPVDMDQTGTVAGSYAISEVKDGTWQQVKFYPATNAGS